MGPLSDPSCPDRRDARSSPQQRGYMWKFCTARVQVSPRIMKVAGARIPALADVRTPRLFADSVEVQPPHDLLELAVHAGGANGPALFPANAESTPAFVQVMLPYGVIFGEESSACGEAHPQNSMFRLRFPNSAGANSSDDHRRATAIQRRARNDAQIVAHPTVAAEFATKIIFSSLPVKRSAS